MLILGPYDAALVVLSLGIGILASYTALDLAARVTQTRGWVRTTWLVGGGLVWGAGLWSMHHVGVLSLRNGIPVVYDLSLGLLSAGTAVGASAFALAVVSLDRIRWAGVIAASLFLGLALAGMHYVGMAAVHPPGLLALDGRMGAAAALAAVLAGAVILGFALRVRDDRGHRRPWLRWASASAMGVAVAGMHYTGMAAARPGPGSSRSMREGWPVVVTDEITLSIVVGTVLALGLTLFGAGIDRRVRRRRAETEALRRSQDRFRSLVEASAQIVWTTARDGQITEDQPSWAEFTGQHFDQYSGWGWFSALHPEDRERAARQWEQALAGGQPMETEHRVRRRDGQYRNCLARVVPVLEANGSIREWIGTHTDVTDRTRMVEERDLLAEAGRVFSSSLDHEETLGAISRLLVPRFADWCAVDAAAGDGTLQRLVAAHVDPRKAPLLQDLHERYPPDPESRHGAARVLRMEQSELLQEVSDEQLSAIGAEEEQVALLREVGFASVLCVPLLARGQVLGALTLALGEAGQRYDLRDLAFAEEVARRAATAIDNARLYEEAQQAIRTRDEVLGVVSHDLRNPISAIGMSAQLLLEETLPEDQQRKQFDLIHRSAERMNRLIQDLLDVSRMEAGRLSMDLHPDDPGGILREACELMQPLAEERGQRLTCQVAGDLPRIRADRGRIQQVMSNLIGNAIKFVREGGSIHVQAERVEEGVRVSVTDTGPGIRPEHISRLFDRHWQARGTAHLGAGLGLAISRGIVEAHGGTISAESELGRGTCIHFVLPALSAEPARRVAEAQRPAKSGVEPLAGSPVA